MLNTFYNGPEYKSLYVPTRVVSGAGARHLLLESLPSDRSPVVCVADRYFCDHAFIGELNRAFGGNLQTFFVENEPYSDDVDRLVAGVTSRPARIIAWGGGSTIDTAKAVAAHFLWGEYRVRDRRSTEWLPEVFALPTTAGTGSEASRHYVISDSETGEKRSYRSWRITPSTAFLDPDFLLDMPFCLLLMCAFDAFMHLWETYVCRYEQSLFNDMLSLEGISRILATVPTLPPEPPYPAEMLMDLQWASALGGMAISNIRTGAIHTLAESLASQVRLSHPETLVVFYASVMKQYEEAVKEKVDLLVERLRGRLPEKIIDLAGLIRFWDQRFRDLGIVEHVGNVVHNQSAIDVDRIAQCAARDTVLLKEHPGGLTPSHLKELIEQALDSGLAQQNGG